MNERPKSPSEIYREAFDRATAERSPRERLEKLEEENPSPASLLKGKDIDVTKRTK
jgi:hypothetical protein